jgi:small-conductance mechanosensitive channel/CRP-like cAMP-binding protein
LTEFLESNLSLVAGALLLAIILGIRGAARDRELRRDLRGGLILLATFLVVRSVLWFFEPYLTTGLQRVLHVFWMLTFAFGVIRAGVSVFLWMLRLRNVSTPKILRDVIDGSLYALAAVPILKSQLAVDLTGLLATSAILSLVIGLALQDTLGNLFAGLSLQLERPFQVGDWVTIGTHTGRVAQIAWRATRIETFKGESITLPNNLISKEPVKNFSRASQPVGVDVHLNAPHHVPPNTVKAAVLATLAELPQVLSTPEPRCKTAAYEESSIRYQARFFVREFELADATLDEVYTRLWYRLRREHIDVPFPQRIVHSTETSKLQPDIPPHSIVQLLHSVDLFAKIQLDELEALARRVHPVRFGAGERILVAGTQGETFYLVAEGEVVVRAGRPETDVARLGPGQYFGEISLLTGEPRAATVVAVKDSMLIEFERGAFAHLFEKHPGLARHLSALLAQRRSQLRAHTESVDPVPGHEREEGRIFGRLRQIFALKD